MTRLACASAVLIGVAILGMVALTYPAQSGRAAFSGDNGKMAFDSDRDGNEQIYVMPSSGGQALKLTTGPRNFSPAWSPDGTRIAFVREIPFEPAEIWVMNADGTHQEQLTSSPTQNESAQYPAWSADGSKIAFLRRNAAGDDIKIWTVDSNGSNEAVLIDSAGSDTTPAFSPDGTKIVYSHADAGPGKDYELYLADANGSNPTPLTSNSITDIDPNWSPDGSRIVYECYDSDAGTRNICVIDATGNNQHALPAVNAKSDYNPAWSPDGASLVVESYSVGGPGGLFIMDTDGNNVHTLTEQGDYEPDWQPVSPSSATPTSTPPQNPTQGDVNCSGGVDDEDAWLLLLYPAGLDDGETPGGCLDLGDPESNSGFPWGDVNCDGAVNAIDALYLVAHDAGVQLPPAAGNCFPIGQGMT